MIVRLFGFLDMLAGVCLVLLPFFTLHRLVFVLALYLVAKGYAHRNEILSIIDLIVGVYMLFALLKSFWLLTIIFAGYLFVKGFYSLTS